MNILIIIQLYIPNITDYLSDNQKLLTSLISNSQIKPNISKLCQIK